MPSKLRTFVSAACVFWILIYFYSGPSLFTRNTDLQDTELFKAAHLPARKMAAPHVRTYFEGMNIAYKTQDCFLGKFCFRYLLKPKCNCEDKIRTKVLALVLSKMSNFEKREHIRSTWGDSKYFNKAELRLVFVLSLETFRSVRENRLLEEARLYNDIVVVDFVEHDDNLTLKSLAGLLWSAKLFCTTATFTLKTHDDVFVNTPAMYLTLNTWVTTATVTNIITGQLFKRKPVPRKGKQQVTIDMYNKRFYPPYVDGATYIMSSDVVPRLLTLALNQTGSDFMKMEDIYITGILAEKANIEPTHFDMKLFNTRGRYYGMAELVWRDHFVWRSVMTQEATLDLWATLLRLSNIKPSLPVKTICEVTTPKSKL